MYNRLTRFVQDMRAVLRGPIAPSLFLALSIVVIGVYVHGNTTKPKASVQVASVVATSSLSLGSDAAFDDLVRKIPQLLATSSSSTLTEEQKTYFEGYLKNEGDRIGGAMLRAMVDKVDKSKFKERYTISDLKVVSDDSDGALRAYAHAMGVIANKYAGLKVEKPDNIMKRAIDNKDRAALLSLSLPATDYRNLANELKALPVPQMMVVSHLMVVNGYDVMATSLFQLTRLLDDPTNGEAAWQSYIYQTFYMTKGYAGIIAALHHQGIDFTDSTDPAYNFRWRGDIALPPATNKTSN